MFILFSWTGRHNAFLAGKSDTPTRRPAWSSIMHHRVSASACKRATHTAVELSIATYVVQLAVQRFGNPDLPKADARTRLFVLHGLFGHLEGRELLPRSKRHGDYDGEESLWTLMVSMEDLLVPKRHRLLVQRVAKLLFGGRAKKHMKSLGTIFVLEAAEMKGKGNLAAAKKAFDRPRRHANGDEDNVGWVLVLDSKEQVVSDAVNQQSLAHVMQVRFDLNGVGVCVPAMDAQWWRSHPNVNHDDGDIRDVLFNLPLGTDKELTRLKLTPCGEAFADKVHTEINRLVRAQSVLNAVNHGVRRGEGWDQAGRRVLSDCFARCAYDVYATMVKRGFLLNSRGFRRLFGDSVYLDEGEAEDEGEAAEEEDEESEEEEEDTDEEEEVKMREMLLARVRHAEDQEKSSKRSYERLLEERCELADARVARAIVQVKEDCEVRVAGLKLIFKREAALQMRAELGHQVEEAKAQVGEVRSAAEARVALVESQLKASVEEVARLTVELESARRDKEERLEERLEVAAKLQAELQAAAQAAEVTRLKVAVASLERSSVTESEKRIAAPSTIGEVDSDLDEVVAAVETDVGEVGDEDKENMGVLNLSGQVGAGPGEDWWERDEIDDLDHGWTSREMIPPGARISGGQFKGWYGKFPTKGPIKPKSWNAAREWRKYLG